MDALTVLPRGELNDNLDAAYGLGVRNDILSVHAVIRLQATSGTVRPFVDALAGFKAFQTESTLVVDCFLCDAAEIDSRTELEDSAFSYDAWSIHMGVSLQL